MGLFGTSKKKSKKKSKKRKIDSKKVMKAVGIGFKLYKAYKRGM